MKALKVEFEREVDGRWIADIRALPGVMCYGRTREEAQRKVIELAEAVLADQMEHDETPFPGPS